MWISNGVATVGSVVGGDAIFGTNIHVLLSASQTQSQTTLAAKRLNDAVLLVLVSLIS